MSALIRWWEAPKPRLWVAWSDYCGVAGLWGVYVAYRGGDLHAGVAEGVAWPVHLVRMGWAALGGAA